MDSNKLEKLKQIQYRIKDCCGICIYSNISLDGWGTCDQFRYKHVKHTGEERQLSIHMFGSCDYFMADEYKISPLRKMELYDNEN